MAAQASSSVDIVLVRPARAANVALACRALKSMGLGAPVLVDPPKDLGSEDTRGLAYGAWDLLDGARRTVSLQEAVLGSVLVAGTSGRLKLGEVFTPRRFAEEGLRRAAGGRTSIVFGPERSGLSREELGLCHLTLQIPTHPAQPSLNLAQAVLVVAYELRLVDGALAQAAPVSWEGEDAPALAGELEDAIADFRAASLSIGYLNPQSPDHVLAEWRRLLARGAPTRREVNLLRGLARQMAFAAAAVAQSRRDAG